MLGCVHSRTTRELPPTAVRFHRSRVSGKSRWLFLADCFGSSTGKPVEAVGCARCAVRAAAAVVLRAAVRATLALRAGFVATCFFVVLAAAVSTRGRGSGTGAANGAAVVAAVATVWS